MLTNIIFHSITIVLVLQYFISGMVMVIPSDQIGDFGKVKTLFFMSPNGILNVDKLNAFLPYSIKVISISDIKYINWCIQNGVVGWWSDGGWSESDVYRYNRNSYTGFAYTFYFRNINDAVLFKLKYADDL